MKYILRSDSNDLSILKFIKFQVNHTCIFHVTDELQDRKHYQFCLINWIFSGNRPLSLAIIMLDGTICIKQLHTLSIV